MRKRIARELSLQEKELGDSEDLRLVRFALSCSKTTRDWYPLVGVKHVSTGRYSYQSKRRYVPSPLLRALTAYKRNRYCTACLNDNTVVAYTTPEELMSALDEGIVADWVWQYAHDTETAIEQHDIKLAAWRASVEAGQEQDTY